MTFRVIPVVPFDLIIFGGTGDLARRKIFPSLFYRFYDGQIPENARFLAVARSDHSDEEFRIFVHEALEQFVAKAFFKSELVEAFLKLISFVQIDVTSSEGWADLKAKIEHHKERPLIFYLSVSPRFFESICQNLKTYDLITPFIRIVVEKPFGHDLKSASRLNAGLRENFEEKQIYRIDHYLGKETVQNLMALRFANALFEPLWNARMIDQVQITVSEELGVEGRGGYYDDIGAMRDMVQNHLLQLLCLTAMEPPSVFEADAIRDEKLKVLKSLEPITEQSAAYSVVSGQYRGTQNLSSYLEDVKKQSSNTESFVALKVLIANWRWAGTPFYLRTGKRLRTRMSEIAVFFKNPPHRIFASDAGDVQQNVLVMRLQPDEGIKLNMTIKDPGPGGMRLRGAGLDMAFADSLGSSDWRMPDAYERLLMDVVRGDQTLFMRGDEAEAAWAWSDPIIKAMQEARIMPKLYDSGSSGPEDALMILHQDNRRWRELEI